MADTYTLTFVNHSTNQGDVCLYQADPGLGVPGAVSTAWMVKPSFPGTETVFHWQTQYEFVWGEPGNLKPGATFVAMNRHGAEVGSSNLIAFDKRDGSYGFFDQGPGPDASRLVVQVRGGVSPGQVAVGIGMSGMAIYAVQAMPNMTYTFSPHPTYWIAFGGFAPGEVLDTQKIHLPAQVSFPAGIFAMTAELTPDNSWTVHPTAAASPAPPATPAAPTPPAPPATPEQPK
ncbi:MAG TPA: hypothetical protein VOA80_22835 [Thermoanaerobaculia bacterium]|nr:hypothetical protein [Thermoanaerobaculia bacterium]